MASLEQRFRAIEREYPHNSSLINFYRTIQGQNLSFRRRVFYFNKLVEKGDYEKKDYKEIRDSYCSISPTQEQRFYGGLASKKAGVLPAFS